MTIERSWAGLFLAQAADMAFGAFRLSLAAVIRLDDAEALLRDEAFVRQTELIEIDVPTLIENLEAFSTNTLRLADSYGHAEAARHFFKVAG